MIVSVIIPTLRRPALVLRAIASALAQTGPSIEVIVIVDGPDPQTHEALASIVDPRLRVLSNPVSIGPGPARNLAATDASGEWLAFLDDDDEWLPGKLSRQLDGHGADEAIVLSCRCSLAFPGGTRIWPRRLPAAGERIDDYLFARRTLLHGEGYIATPTLVLPARLFAEAGGFGDTRQHEDIALLLRATQQGKARLVMLPDVLVRIRADTPTDSLGTSYGWRQALDWADSMGAAIGPRAFSGFCLVTLGAQAARQRDVSAIPVLLRRAFRQGAPSPLQLLLFAGFWASSQRLRHTVNRMAARLRPSRPATATPPC
jgi:hypothetical protein